MRAIPPSMRPNMTERKKIRILLSGYKENIIYAWVKSSLKYR